MKDRIKAIKRDIQLLCGNVKVEKINFHIIF